MKKSQAQLEIDFSPQPKPKGKHRCRLKNVPVRPTEEQLAELHQRKSKFGYKSLSKFLIERGLREGEMIAIVDPQKVDRLLFEVRKLGVNINQIARRLNEGGRPYAREALDRAIRQAEEILSEVSEAITR